MKKILFVALICLGWGQNLLAEVAKSQSFESAEFKSAESFGESTPESIESKTKSLKSKSAESTESTQNQSTAEQSTLWQSNANEKSGGFLGFEYGLGLTKVSIGMGDNVLKTAHLSSYANIIAGYQWYFLDRDWAHLGLRFGVSVGYSSYGIKNKFVLSSENSNNDTSLDVEAHNVRYGADLAFVWDFLDSYAHTLGIFITPLGLEGNTILGTIKERVATTTTKHKISTTTKIAYKLSAGLQYSFKRHHLLFFAYRGLYNNGKIPKGAIDIYGGVGSASMSHSGFVGYAYKF